MAWSEEELRLIRQREGFGDIVINLRKATYAPHPVGGPTVEAPEVWVPRDTTLDTRPMPVSLMMPLGEPPAGFSRFWTVNAEWHFGLVTGTPDQYHDAVFTAMERDRERQ
jgi:hypothetical protein